MPNNFDISAIERAVGDAIRAIGVSSKVFYNRPRSSTLNLKDFVVVKVTGGIDDQLALGRFTLSVQLFALDVANMKNDKKLSVMQSDLIGGLPHSIDRMLIDGTPNIIGDVSDGLGYHSRLINYSTIIKII